MLSGGAKRIDLHAGECPSVEGIERHFFAVEQGASISGVLARYIVSTAGVYREMERRERQW